MALKLQNDGEEITITDLELVGEGGDPNTKYTIRKLTPQKQRQIVKEHTRPGNHRRAESQDWDAIRDDQITYILVAWEGVFDGGKVAECSRENKLKLDAYRRGLLIDKAGLAEVVAAEDARGESFRSDQGVR